jgi:hypothetical protein
MRQLKLWEDFILGGRFWLQLQGDPELDKSTPTRVHCWESDVFRFMLPVAPIALSRLRLRLLHPSTGPHPGFNLAHEIKEASFSADFFNYLISNAGSWTSAAVFDIMIDCLARLWAGQLATI